MHPAHHLGARRFVVVLPVLPFWPIRQFALVLGGTVHAVPCRGTSSFLGLVVSLIRSTGRGSSSVALLIPYAITHGALFNP